MMSPSTLAHPPRIASWLVELFASAEQAESILGDLSEEFSDLASRSGIDHACRPCFALSGLIRTATTKLMCGS